MNNILTTTKAPCTHHLLKNLTNSSLVTNLTNISTNMDHSDHANMDHSNHDMSGHGHNHGTGGDFDMKMWFHLGDKEIILFDFWKTNTIYIFVASCIILCIMAALYEGLKLLREILIRNELLRQQREQRNGASTNNTNRSNSYEDNENGNRLLANTATNNNNINSINNDANGTGDDIIYSNKQKRSFINKSQLLSKAHIVQTLLHMLQVTISYLLMLVFMTYNVWLCLSVVLGAGIGYFLFGFKRMTTIDVNEHCH